MPSRVLRDWTDSLRFDGISADAERLFVRLIMKADDYGRFHAEPRLVRAGCFPLSESLRTNDLTRWLDELSNRQLILRYETQGRNFLAIVNFSQRLRITRAKFPQPVGQPENFLPLLTEKKEHDSNPPQVAADCGNPPPEASLDLDSDSGLEIELPPNPPPRSPASPSRGVVEGRDSAMLPTTEQSKRIARIFHRNLSTPWSEKEVKAYKKIGSVPEEDLAALERYYAANWPPKRDVNILRHDLVTFLNNFPGEVDRAKSMKGKGKSSTAGEWLDSTPKAPPTDPAEEERIRQAVKAQAATLKEQLGR